MIFMTKRNRARVTTEAFSLVEEHLRNLTAELADLRGQVYSLTVQRDGYMVEAARTHRKLTAIQMNELGRIADELEEV